VTHPSPWFPHYCGGQDWTLDPLRNKWECTICRTNPPVDIDFDKWVEWTVNNYEYYAEELGKFETQPLPNEEGPRLVHNHRLRKLHSEYDEANRLAVSASYLKHIKQWFATGSIQVQLEQYQIRVRL